MSQSRQTFIEKRIVSNEIIPERLFACFAKVSPEAVAALSRTYDAGERTILSTSTAFSMIRITSSGISTRRFEKHPRSDGKSCANCWKDPAWKCENVFTRGVD